MKKTVCIILLTLCIFISFYTNSFTSNSSTIKISAIGDVIMHKQLKWCARANNKRNANGQSINNHGYDYFFKRVSHIFKKHDYTIANMEFPIVKPYKNRAIGRVPFFSAEPAILPAFQRAGINIVNFANNHCFDQRRRGITETINNLIKYKMPFIGAGRNEAEARKGLIIQKGNIKIGLIGYCSVWNANLNSRNPNKPKVNDFNKYRKVIQDIRKMKKKVDFLILNVHWGVQYHTKPRRYDIRMARKYINAGVDMIIGHHPHMLQYVETVRARDGRKAFIAYCIGNYLSNQGWQYKFLRDRIRRAYTRDSVIMSFVIEKKQKAYLKKVLFIPMWNVNQITYKNRRAIHNIRTVPLYDLLRDVNNQINNNRGNKRKLLLRRKMLRIRLREIKKLLFQRGIPKNVYFYKPGDHI